MPTYETIFALPSVVTEEEQTQSVKEIEEQIVSSGGTVTATEEMGEKKMAYTVQGFERAYYYLIKFDSPAKSIAGIKRFYQIHNHRYIRNIVVKES